jgi:transposase-like protein
MDEKLRFVARYLDGEKIAALCREFGISRVTGHSIIDRYRDSGMEAFTDRSRRPYRQANQLPMQVEKLILLIKQEWPTWGAPKVRERLITQYPSVRPPAKSTVHAVLARHGLVKSKKRRRRPKGRREGRRRGNLAGQLHALRDWLLRSRYLPGGACG